jgi:hypothetical protein
MPHRGRRRVLELEPVAIERAGSLRHDALAAEFAGLLIDDLAVADEMLVERDALRRLAQQQLGQSRYILTRGARPTGFMPARSGRD